MADAQNSISLATYFGVDPDSKVITYSIFRDLVLALGESFKATSSQAFPMALTDFWQRGRDCPDLPIAWIFYIGPRYASLVMPPSTAIVEHRPDGGLLMAATDATFDVDDLAHMAVARDIAAAVAPFNGLPRPLQDRGA